MGEIKWVKPSNQSLAVNHEVEKLNGQLLLLCMGRRLVRSKWQFPKLQIHHLFVFL